MKLKLKKDADEYYHVTTQESIDKIKECGFIGVDYFGEGGFYISDDIHECQYFGDKAIVIESFYLEESDLHTDDTNDGIFHKGYLPFLDFVVMDVTELLEE